MRQRMKYSIITINYNNREGLRKTIESVVNQTCTDFEYIVIDGGSTDGSVDVIKQYAARIDFWVSEPDKGIYNAMNKGISHAHGEYLNFMNSGDCFHDANVLKELLPWLTAEVIFGRAYIPQINDYWKPYNKITLFSCFVGLCHQAILYHNDLFKNEVYDEHFRYVADWKFTTKKIVKEHCSYNCVDIVVADYDLSGVSSANEVQVKQERTEVLYSLFPSGVADDYMFFAQLRTPLLEEIPLWVKHPALHKVIVRMVHLLTNFFKLVCRLTGKDF